MRSKARGLCSKILGLLPQAVQYGVIGRWRNPPTHEYFSEAAERKAVRVLREALASTGRPSIWMLPTQTWFSSGFQRPHQLARAWAELGNPVIFVEPWNCNPAWITEDTRMQRRFRGARRLASNLWLLRCPPERLAYLLKQIQPDAVLMTWPHQVVFLGNAAPSAVIYEMIDHQSIMNYKDDVMQSVHEKWIRAAAVVAGSADDIVADLKRVRADVLQVPNGVRLEDWAFDREPPCPADMLAARQANVVVGYYGALADWFDWRMVEAAALLRPDWAFVLIGYPYDGDVDRVRARIRSITNIHYLGAKPFGELKNYLAHFDVATIPFVLNQITHACSPVKLFEYMAAHKPIVVTPMRELLKYPSLLFAVDEEDFVKQVQVAVSRRKDASFLQQLRRDASENTWIQRAQLLIEAWIAAQAGREFRS